MLVIASLLNHTSYLYLFTVSFWVTTRITPFPCIFVFFPALVIFLTRSKLQNRSIVEQLSNNRTFLISNLVSLVWLCLNRSSWIIFQKFDSTWSFYLVALLWFGAPFGTSLFPQNWKYYFYLSSSYELVLSNNITFLIYNLIYLVWLCLNKNPR